MIVRRIHVRRALGTAIVVGLGLGGLAATPASAETVALSCSGLSQIVTMNPPTGSSSAKYIKWAVKDSDGSKVDLFSVPIPADALTCAVDSGIRTNQTTQDVKYLLDDQSNGAATLTTAGPVAKTTMSFTGSGSCRTDVPETSYPAAYPLQGKAIIKFDQLTATSTNIQLQAYVRLQADAADPEDDIAITGIVTKGPGIGGQVRGTFALFPTNSVKNINVIDCIAAVPAGNAVTVEMKLSQADGSDPGAGIDPLEVVIP